MKNTFPNLETSSFNSNLSGKYLVSIVFYKKNFKIKLGRTFTIKKIMCNFNFLRTKRIICDQENNNFKINNNFTTWIFKKYYIRNDKKALKNRKNCRDFSINGGDPKEQRVAHSASKKIKN